MTGGHVLILGTIGRNFGAGMSGGLAYIFQEDNKLDQQFNTEMILLESLASKDYDFIKYQLKEHHRLTGSSKAARILDSWDLVKDKFIKVFPKEYKAVLDRKNKVLVQTQQY